MIELQLELFPGHIAGLLLVELSKPVEDFASIFIQGTWECALLDAGVVFHKSQLLTAVNVAFQRFEAGRLKTHSLHNEVMLALSAKLSIRDGLAAVRFSWEKTRCLVVAVDPPASFPQAAESTSNALAAKVRHFPEGANELFNELLVHVDKPSIQNLYGTDIDPHWICTKIATVEYVRQLR
ncbi:hypothetical protein, conserved [Cyanidioschyzon merolae strain 10D]|jgi:hypothetical protein|uniref:Uncharacterized protein n=1 Tax=Cyanidioschyzon merolae (strain NIES-3377 / 10D) TaxID=280699 RepID=M1VI89_CYAM1|nr:hypothetical protein, conserved [Cyanidioschyzon merolae strain 10D]BAM83242.1 hypothetical protein, conserved [Cyanidioschyzon merolae strain 10D]|eukprot:XP_005539278.1 hypothetical protein, conserved [Cyanidioschyzon merolae strain 10D]